MSRVTAAGLQLVVVLALSNPVTAFHRAKYLSSKA
jgi:hypothetical protein